MHTPASLPLKPAPSADRPGRVAATALSAGVFTVPLVLSASSSPTPAHPRTLAWYRSLRQPIFKPPDWVIPLAWTTIEGFLSAAGVRLLRAAPSAPRSRSLALLGWNVFMIGGWSRLFFKRRALGVSTVAAASMIATGAAFVGTARRVDPVAARNGVPFVGWVACATVLTASIWWLNRPAAGRRRMR